MSWPWANWASDDESDGESYADAVERVTAGERAEREGGVYVLHANRETIKAVRRRSSKIRVAEPRAFVGVDGSRRRGAGIGDEVDGGDGLD